MPFQCCHMGLLRLHAQLVQLLQGQRDQAKDMTRALQKQPQDTEEITKDLKEIQAKQDQQAWEFQNLQNQMGQEANGEFLGANDQCYQVIAQLIRQQGEGSFPRAFRQSWPTRTWASSSQARGASGNRPAPGD